MKHCLVVEDSRVMRTVARRIFEELQFDIGEAEDGMAALRACREKMPDLIFLDWNLPVACRAWNSSRACAASRTAPIR